MKKYFCVLLTVLLSFATFSFSAFATGGVTVSKLNAYLQKGETLELSVTFNTDMVSNAFLYDIEYDSSVFRFVSVTGGSCNEYEQGKLRYVNIGNSKSDKAVFRFYAKSAAKTNVKITNIYSADTKEYNYSAVTYSVTVDAATRGDVNNDGKINTTDLALLKLYLANIEKSVSSFADYDKNQVVDTTDMAALKLYLVGV